MNTIALTIYGLQVGLSEIMLLALGAFVIFLILRNLILYQFRPQAD
ncbi:hypothetical protein PBAL39_17091 [Pedobacter sp. BAL39]|nr:hypothetical protein [Pedobacter sp. BAL39]EDM35218.1 hypothetical protein PBAL39_17091 [Pedobacter sp. BAL39]